MNIIEEIKAIPNLSHLSGCKTSQIKSAQKELGLDFPDEYVEYVKQFGAISFAETEWTGLNVEGYFNVVTATLKERKIDKNFPQGYFVLENLGIEGLLTIVNSNGSVYSYQSQGKPKMICKSLSEYLKLCLSNNS